MRSAVPRPRSTRSHPPSTPARKKQRASSSAPAVPANHIDPELTLDPVESAKAAGLRYVSDSKPGIRRLRAGKSFRYVDAAGKAVRDKDTLARIRSLVIPPAWSDVWICAIANGHLQATGRDARGRKQSRYHPKWREVRDETKYEKMAAFAEALPAIRKRVADDLGLPGLPRQKVVGAIVSLMEQTHIRVGNEEYARQNQSYGLTTMRNKHVEVEGSKVTFSFQGKSRVHHTVSLQDRRLARIIKRCEELPGYELFQYVDREGATHSIDSADVNDYLREITGQHFTAKDFRTWAGTVLACDLLREFPPFNSETEARRNIVQAIKAVASQLGNTPSVCRKCYVHPAVLEAYLGGITVQQARKDLDHEIAAHETALRQEEKALMQLLAQRALLEKAA
ncbi:MAG TPA: DNA topoisomerase IB [Acidobacteriaceae bacterium]|jgi:DNA topoisomerase-1